MIHQLVAALSAHDAIGNIARLYQAILRDRVPLYRRMTP